MAVKCRTAPAVLIDRYYRGAVVMVGTSCYALAEPYARLVERLRHRWESPRCAAEEALVRDLVGLGVLEER